MIITEKMFYPELVDIYQGTNNFEELINFATEKLAEMNFIETSYPWALKEREQEYPTGLQTTSFAVAIPHTDPSHIKKTFIYVIKLKPPIRFGQMGTTDQFVAAHYAFLLGFNKGEEQLQLLKNLMEMFMDQKVMKQLAQTADTATILETVTDFFKLKKGE